MSSFSGQVSVGTDDADQLSTGTNNTTNANTPLKNASSPAHPYWACRLQDVTVPSGATVSAAALSVYCATSGLSMDAKIYGVKTANPSTFAATSNYISGLSLTTASVTWSATLTESQFNNSPDITSIISELIGQGGWTSGNAMAFVLVAQSASLSCTVENYDGSSSEAAELSITYTGGAVPGQCSDLTIVDLTSTSVELRFF